MSGTGRPPLVSVVVPTYNGAETIRATIESVLAQTLADFELIVVDDGSADATADIVGAMRDPRLRYLRNPANLGPEGNWNRCVELATGRYFKLLPHDDLIAPRCLERQVEVLERDRDQRIALVFSAREVLAPDGRVLMNRGLRGAGEGRVAAAVLSSACVRRGTNLIGEPGAVLVRRDAMCRIGRFDATNPYVIDLDYWLRMLTLGDAWYCDEPLAGFRVSAGQWSVRIGGGQARDMRRMVHRLRARGVLADRAADRLLGAVTPSLNNVARLVFYRLLLK